MANPAEKSSDEQLRATREGLRKSRSKAAVGAESPSGEDWPPGWCVTFSDMMTLLMCFFVLWYALTAMKLPPELLAIRTTQAFFQPTDAKGTGLVEIISERLEKGKISEIEEFVLTEETARLIKDVAEFQKKAKALEDFLERIGLAGQVIIELFPDKMVITPSEAVLFQKGSTALKPTSVGVLDAIVQILKTSTGNIRIEGHTDDSPIGPFYKQKYASNWELSAARAVHIVEYLVKNGVEPSRVSAAGYGETKPIVQNTTETNKAKNRRVEFHILLEKELRI